MSEMAKDKLFTTKFFEEILNSGTKTLGSDAEHDRGRQLPDFYDKVKIKRAQKFYHDNICSLLFSKLLGLFIGLAYQKASRVLRMTEQSSTPKTAFKRYRSTILHMTLWYESDFGASGTFWKSIEYVKKRHRHASHLANSYEIGEITQWDLVVAQIGFMSMAVIRTDMVGLHDEDIEQNLEAFVHFWRVLGYLFGIENKYNICRESLSETRAICEVVLNDVFKPEFMKMDDNFQVLTKSLIEGMWSFNPFLNYNRFSNIAAVMFNGPEEILEANNNKKLRTKYFKYKVVRFFANSCIRVSLWLMRYCPILAYYQFGRDII